ncbi:MAG: RagB/SusD family nutrient uptake outer membrane protein [Bacteroidota bacterium]
MKFNNVKYIGFAILSGLLLTNCTDELDLAPLSAVGDNAYYSNTEEVESGVIAIYDGLQQVPLREFALTEMRSDNTRTKSSEGDWAQFENFQVQPTNVVVASYWPANYNVIFRANRVLENLEVVDGSLRGQFEGEAKFARALGHFNLVRAYGDIPLVDRVIAPTESDFFDRDDTDKVLSTIDADLTSAASLLPADITFGRATKGAAEALLAKVKLTTGDYSGARTLLESIINSGEYALLDNYSDVFYNEGNSEIIFAIPYVDDDANESQDFSFEFTEGGVVSGLNFATNDFIDSIDPADTRITTFFNPTAVRQEEVGKFITQSSDARLCGNDWIVLRYADVLLMYAEAIMAGNGETSNADALAAVNDIRTRVGLEPITGILTEDMLLQERRHELAFENHRLYDLIRFGKAESVLSAFAAAEGYNFAPTDLLLPIPQNEINVSNGELSQNPGY